jgi:hypothetical protein
MTKNNQIPIEVKKPFETVAELKNETPSFEEFMKDYKADERVVDSYENEFKSYGNIGVEKGYGPIGDCYQEAQTTISRFRFYLKINCIN